MTGKNVLKEYNKHVRDEGVRFYSRGHKYEIENDSKSKYVSVTTWNHKHFPKFDADKVIENIFNGKNWGPDNKYWGMTAQQIKDSWKSNGLSAASSGTSLHEKIEIFMNNDKINVNYTHDDLYQHYISLNKEVDNPDLNEWNYFINFVRDHSELKPYRTEWMVFDEDVKIAGSIDMVYENPDGTLSIYDWKRSKDISKMNNKFAINPIISHIHDSNFWHYTFQLNTYKAILERKYNKIVTKLCLVRLHPNNPNSTYELLDVPLMEKEMSELFAEREKEIQ